MKNPSSYLGLNKKSLESKLRDAYNIQNISRTKLELPKINLLSECNPFSDQKTLTKLIEKLQKYVGRCQKKAPQILHECLATLKVQLNEAIRRHNRDIRILKTEAQQKQNYMSQAYLTKSHVVNLNSSNIKKIESKELFDKVSSVKMQKSGFMTKQTDKEVIESLKAKIEEKDQVINGLKRQIQEMKTKLCNQQMLVETQKNSNQKLLHQKQKLFKELSIETCTSKSLNEKLVQLNSQIKILTQEKEKFEGHCSIFKSELVQREAELKSIWLITLNNDQKK